MTVFGLFSWMFHSLRGARKWTLILFVASLVLSLASFATTFRGIGEFIDAVWLAASITFGVQTILFVISWWLGTKWRDGVFPIVFGGGVFLFCFAVSAFFSYADWFSLIDGGRMEENNRLRMRTQVDEVLRWTETELDNNLEVQQRQLVEGDRTRLWKTDVQRIVDSARAAPAKIREIADREQSEIQRSIRNLTREREAIQTTLNSITNSAEETAEKISGLDESLTAVNAEIREKEDELAELNRDLDSLVSQQEFERTTGEGPRFRELGEKIFLQNRSIAGAEATLAGLQERREILELDLGYARQPLDPGGPTQLDLKNQLSDIDLQLAKLAEQSERITNNLANDPTKAIDEIDAHYAAFDRGQTDAVGKVEQVCGQIRDQLLKLDLDVGQSTGGCTSTPLRQQVNSYNDHRQHREDYGKSCGRDVFLTALGEFTDMYNFATDCLSKSDLAGPRVADFQEALFQINQTRGPQAHRFSVVMAALRDGNPLAVLALGLAGGIDLLVLLCALIGSNIGTSSKQKSFTALNLELEDAKQGNADNVEAVLVLDADGKIDPKIKIAINSIADHGLLRRAEEPDGRVRYDFLDGARAFIKGQMESHRPPKSNTWSGSSISPSGNNGGSPFKGRQVHPVSDD